jgi:outer membrane receptor protein involved in Fe transport
VFAQDEMQVHERLTLIAGARYQDNTAESFATPGLDQEPVSTSDATGVWAVNALVRMTDGVRVVAAASRGFRSPNLVERFYHGVTPEGSGFQSRNLGLRSESSLNLDIGLRVQRPRWSLELFAFQNQVRDGIRIEATGDTVQGFPEFRNVNIDRLRVRGLEAMAIVAPFNGLSLVATATTIAESDIDRPLEPVGDGYGSKLTGAVRYRLPSGRAWGALRLRHQGVREGGAGAEALVGNDIPGFTVMDLDLGLLAFQVGRTAHLLTATIENLTDQLYAEAGNAGFFRPAPGQRVLVTWRSEF